MSVDCLFFVAWTNDDTRCWVPCFELPEEGAERGGGCIVHRVVRLD